MGWPTSACSPPPMARIPQTPSRQEIQVHVYKYSRVRGTRTAEVRKGRGQARSGCGRTLAGIIEMHFPTLPLPSRGDSLADHLAQLVHILEQHVVVCHGPKGTAAAAWRAPKTGVGAPKSSVPSPWFASSPQDPLALGAEDARVGREARRLRRLPLRATAPARAPGPGRGNEGGPGPAPPARPLLLPLLGPRCPACGSSGTARPRSPLVSPHGPRGRDRSLC